MIEENASLKKYNTFGIDVTSRYFASFSNEDILLQILNSEKVKNILLLPLGGGSNILFTKNFEGIVLKNNIPGIKVIEDRGDTCLVRSGSGVVWNDFVNWCIGNDLQGIENLSLIPGCVGAAPIQNIGAYGVEVKNTFHSLDAIEISSGKKLMFNNEQCRFGYRDSVFKNELKGKLIITSVTLELHKQHQLNLSYGAIESELSRMGVEQPTLRSVSDAVCNIRRSKLPDPAVIGNAGSFFKNPEVDAEFYSQLKIKNPELVAYPTHNGNMKLAAGWLIEQCGWKGKVVGNTGSHKDQALVLVNYGKASGQEILDLAMKIMQSVKSQFDVDIVPEVNIM